jgi:hypothetical protein
MVRNQAADVALSLSGRGSFPVPTETEANEVGIESNEARDIVMLQSYPISLCKM